jgi:hypothetical protein
VNRNLEIERAADRWLLVEAAGMDGKLELPSLRIAISLAEVFANVDFAPAPFRPP